MKMEGSTRTQMVVVEEPEDWAAVGTVAVAEGVGEDYSSETTEAMENGIFGQGLQEEVNLEEIWVVCRVNPSQLRIQASAE